MHDFDVILLSDVIWAFGPNVTRRVPYTDAGRRPYDMWPYKENLFKIVGSPVDYLIRRWFANRWNRMGSVLFVTILT